MELGSKPEQRGLWPAGKLRPSTSIDPIFWAGHCGVAKVLLVQSYRLPWRRAVTLLTQVRLPDLLVASASAHLL